MTKTKMYRTFTKNFPTIFRKIIFHEISPKSFSWGFLLIFKISKICPKTENFQKIMAHGFYQKHFLNFHNFPKFFENFETIMSNIHFWLLLSSWIRRAGWCYPARWSANQIARKQGRMSIHIITWNTKPLFFTHRHQKLRQVFHGTTLAYSQ